jgi:hypothetical protein
VPEQDFLPPRGPARPPLPDSAMPGSGGGQAPWAGLPPVRPRRDRDDRDPGPPSARRAAPGRRAVRAAARRRRRLLAVAAGLAVAGGALAAVLLPGGRPGPAQVTPNALITTFLPGELRQVPAACGAVPAATVRRYLPGRVTVAAPLPVNGAAESACNWSLNAPPVWRLLDLTILAYAPSSLASGDGSATNAAEDAYAATLQGMRSPPPRSPAPRAAVTTLTGLGDQAFRAMQVFRGGGSVTDVATVVVRYHNVIVTVKLNGLQHSNRGSYGPVSGPQLSAAALAFAQAAEAALH